MSETYPSSNPNNPANPKGPDAPFVPASPLTSKDVIPTPAGPDEPDKALATVTDINKFRDDKESRAGRPPAGPVRSIDIRKRDAVGSLGADEAPQLATLPPSPLTQPGLGPDTVDTARADIGDLVNIDAKGRGHEPSQTNVSGKKSGGQFISEDNMDVIAANADDIRDNLPGSDTTPDNTTPDATTPDTTTPDSTTPDTTTPDTTTPDSTAPDSTATEDISDLVNISKDNLDTIAANADFIRDNLPGDELTPDLTPPEPPTPDGPEPTLEPPIPEPPTPDGPEPTPEEPTPEEGGPSGPEGSDVNERLAEAERRLDTATERYARARVNSERIFGGRNDEELQLATAELQEAYREYSASIAEKAASTSADMAPRIEAINHERSVISSKMEAINQSIADAEPTDDISVLYNNLRVYRERQEELNAEEARINAEQTRLEADSQAEVVERLSQVRQNVDSQMLAERERTSPALARMAEWLRRHPRVRIVAGLALVGTGFIGAVTGNVPLVVGAMAGRAALGAFGGYNAARGVGEWIGDKKYNRSDVNSIEGYTEAAERQSKTRRKSKKTGAALGAAAAAIPIIKGIGQLNDMVNAPKPPVPSAPKAPLPTPPSPPAPPELPVTDTRFPWTHMTDQIGSNGTPRIMEIANNAPNLGWQVIGNGQGGGNGAILRIIDPVGKVYAGNGPINAALDYLGTQTP